MDKKRALPVAWGALAKELGTTVRSLRRWRRAHPDAPKGGDADAWKAFMSARGLGPFSARKNAPPFRSGPANEADEGQAPDRDGERELRLRERRAALATAEHKLKVQKGEVLPLAEFQAALRATVGAFDAALKQIPPHAADKLILTDRHALTAKLRAELTKSQFAKIEAILEAPRDYTGIVAIIETEVEACRAVLAQADFLEPDPASL